MKYLNKLRIVIFISLLSTSCSEDINNETSNENQEPLENKSFIFEGDEVFNQNFMIKTIEGEMVKLNKENLISFLNGKMFDSENVLDLKFFSIEKNPDETTNEYAIVAKTSDHFTEVSALMNMTHNGFELLGGTCECSSNCEYGCNASIWGTECRCSRCSPNGVCTKKSTIKVPSLSYFVQ